MTAVVETAPAPQPRGSFYAWWRDDPLPRLEPLEGFAAEPTGDTELLARLGSGTRAGVLGRQRSGHRAFLAALGGEAVGYGWSATRSAEIGELGISFPLAAEERYLWDFLTLPAWRGRGVYPHLLQAVLSDAAEHGVTRCWIGHAPGNGASARGILRAGFRPVGELYLVSESRLAIVPSGPPTRARLAADLLGVDLLDGRWPPS